MDGRRIDDAVRLYALAARVGALEALRAAFRDHIRASGLRLVKDEEKVWAEGRVTTRCGYSKDGNTHIQPPVHVRAQAMCSLERLCRNSLMWGRLGMMWGRLGMMWGRLGMMLGRLGMMLGRLGMMSG
eukprot:365344-Chlamydomonas_euryale.AAC.2